MADRVGVINKGELILVEDKAELMRKLGKKQLTLQLHEPLRADSRRSSPITSSSSSGDGSELDLHLRRAGRAARHRRAARRPRRGRASASRTCRRRRARSKTSSSAWCGRQA